MLIARQQLSVLSQEQKVLLIEGLPRKETLQKIHKNGLLKKTVYSKT